MTKEKLSGYELSALLFVGQFGADVVFFPRPLLVFAGQAALISLIVVILVAGASLALTLVALETRARKGTADSLPRLFAGAAGKVAGALLLLGNLLYLALTLRGYSQLVKSFFYPAIPLWFLVAALLLTVFVSRTSSPIPIARTAEVVLMVVIPLYLVSTGLLLPRLSLAYAVLPPPHLQIGPIFLGVWKSIFIVASFDPLIVLMPYTRAGGVRGVKRHAAYAVMAFSAFLVLWYVTVVGLFGPVHTLSILWPLFTAYRVVAFPAFLLDRVGLILIVAGVLVLTIFLTLRTWVVGQALQGLFGVRSTSLTRTAILVALFFLALIPLTPTSVEKLLETLLVPVSWAVAFGVPFLLLIPQGAVGRRRGPPRPLRAG